MIDIIALWDQLYFSDTDLHGLTRIPELDNSTTNLRGGVHMTTITAILPAYNEDISVLHSKQHVDRVVVDDGSNYVTAEIAEERGGAGNA